MKNSDIEYDELEKIKVTLLRHVIAINETLNSSNCARLEKPLFECRKLLMLDIDSIKKDQFNCLVG